MSNVLVTGLAIGSDVGVCQACNFDFDWILERPSVLVWADRILVTKATWDAAVAGKGLSEHPALARSLKLVFEMATAEGIIRVMDAAKVVAGQLRDVIWAEAERDRALLAELLPERAVLGDDEGVPGELFIDGYGYCLPRIATTYATLVLARAWDANCLFSQGELNYCTYKFGVCGLPREGNPALAQGFQSVFRAFVPNTPILPEYVLECERTCPDCAHEKECKEGYLSTLERNLRGLFAFREYDQIQQLRGVVDDISRNLGRGGDSFSSADLVREFRGRERKLRRLVRGVFPKVRRWASLTAMVSVPIAVLGLASESALVTVSGATLGGLSKVASELVKVLTSRCSWVGFTSSATERQSELPEEAGE